MWVKLAIQPLRERIADVLECSLVQARMKSMLESWRRAKMCIHLHLVEFLGKRRAVIEGILLQFKRFQAETVKTKVNLALEMVNDQMKTEEIAYQVRKREKQYLAELKAQVQAANWLQETVKKFRLKAKVTPNYAFDSSTLPEVPPKPVLRLDFTKEDFEEIIGKFLDRRHSTSTAVSHKKKSKRHSIQPRNRGHSKNEKFP